MPVAGAMTPTAGLDLGVFNMGSFLNSLVKGLQTRRWRFVGIVVLKRTRPPMEVRGLIGVGKKSREIRCQFLLVGFWAKQERFSWWRIGKAMNQEEDDFEAKGW